VAFCTRNCNRLADRSLGLGAAQESVPDVAKRSSVDSLVCRWFVVLESHRQFVGAGEYLVGGSRHHDHLSIEEALARSHRVNNDWPFGSADHAKFE
jgi:hypothetical protein